MDDIVTRLARAASALDGEHMRTCLAAIDEITALRHAVRDCADDLAGEIGARALLASTTERETTS